MTNVSVSAAVEALDGADLSAATTANCVDLLRHVRHTRGWLDAVEARITSRMRELAAAASPTADAGVADMHGAVGGVSATEGRRKDRRSKTLDEAPSFGSALATGSIGAEHVDALANALATASDDIKAELLAEQESLLGAAATKTPEEFARTAGSASANSSATTASAATGSSAARRSSCDG